MITRFAEVDPVSPDPKIIEEAGELIRNGGLVAFPTETVYGLGGDAFKAESSKKIYAAKGRPSDNPLIVHIADPEAAEKAASDIPETYWLLADAFWPGPLTMIIKKSEAMPEETTGGLDTVAIRLPSHPVAAALIKASGGYIAAPSANASGRPSPTSAKHVKEDLDGRIDMIIDGGSCSIGLESTIVDLSSGKPQILRPGFITKEMLEDVLGEVELDPTLLKPSAGRPKAPGMRYRHYAPQGEMHIYIGEQQAVSERINSELDKAKAYGKRCGVICTEETRDKYEADSVVSVGSRDDVKGAAAEIYAVLRDFDDKGIEVICSEAFSEEGYGLALMNRLYKACGYQVVRV
ncbi:MAG: threonylcarbamoyl-AMP synthase [Lachnospiraceae bacterium]|nr:threonylcarbamoyl-AMP synthase [Lachnospiraceae bacterium]